MFKKVEPLKNIQTAHMQERPARKIDLKKDIKALRESEIRKPHEVAPGRSDSEHPKMDIQIDCKEHEQNAECSAFKVLTWDQVIFKREHRVVSRILGEKDAYAQLIVEQLVREHESLKHVVGNKSSGLSGEWFFVHL